SVADTGDSPAHHEHMFFRSRRSGGIIMRRVFVLLITLAAGMMVPAAASAQTVQPMVQQRTVHLIEFDLPMNADSQPGAMIVDTRGDDNNRLWFVTRLGTPHVFRLSPQKSPMKGSAQFT